MFPTLKNCLSALSIAGLLLFSGCSLFQSQEGCGCPQFSQHQPAKQDRGSMTKLDHKKSPEK
jgi:hypothetical protein